MERGWRLQSNGMAPEYTDHLLWFFFASIRAIWCVSVATSGMHKRQVSYIENILFEGIA